MHSRRLVLIAVMFAIIWIGGSHTLWAQEPIDVILAKVDTLYHARSDNANVRESTVILRQAIVEYPSADGAYWRLARSLSWIAELSEKSKRVYVFAEAKEMAERAVALNPRGLDGLYWLAICTIRWGEERGVVQSLRTSRIAKQALEKATDIDPLFAPAHYALATLYRTSQGVPLGVGNRKKALEEAQLAVRLDSTNVSYQLELAESYLANRMYTEAMQTLDKVIHMPSTPSEPIESNRAKSRAAELLRTLNS